MGEHHDFSVAGGTGSTDKEGQVGQTRWRRLRAQASLRGELPPGEQIVRLTGVHADRQDQRADPLSQGDEVAGGYDRFGLGGCQQAANLPLAQQWIERHHDRAQLERPQHDRGPLDARSGEDGHLVPLADAVRLQTGGAAFGQFVEPIIAQRQVASAGEARGLEGRPLATAHDCMLEELDQGGIAPGPLLPLCCRRAS